MAVWNVAKSKYWYCRIFRDTLLVSDTPDIYGWSKIWKVRAITWKAAGRKLIRGGTIAEHIAKREFEWDNPFQPYSEDSPAKDREKPSVKKIIKEIKIERYQRGKRYE